MEINEAVQLFMEYMRCSLPFALVFSIGTMLVNMFLNAFTKGWISFK